jgi:glutathione peroxidase-family protein
LYDKYHSQGLEILAFPCNQFGAQEPNDEPEILHFLRANYQVTFPVFEKVLTLIFLSEKCRYKIPGSQLYSID